MQKAIVIGSLGFIGYHLCERLLGEGIEVVGIDALLNPKRKAVQEEMLLFFGRNAQFHFINENVLAVDLQKVTKEADVVFHLANSDFSIRNGKQVSKQIQSALTVTKKVIAACAPAKTPLIYASSLAVYGNRFGKITETSPVSPDTPLGLLKVAEEALLTQKTDKARIPLLILRLPFVYGPWQHEDHLFQRLFLRRLKGKQLAHVEWDSSYEENLLYIDDVIQAMWQATKHRFVNEIFNVASSEENQWNRAMEWFLQKPYERKQPFKPLPRWFSTEKAEKKLNYRPAYSIEEGLQKQQDYLKKWALFSKI